MIRAPRCTHAAFQPESLGGASLYGFCLDCAQWVRLEQPTIAGPALAAFCRLLEDPSARLANLLDPRPPALPLLSIKAEDNAASPDLDDLNDLLCNHDDDLF